MASQQSPSRFFLTIYEAAELAKCSPKTIQSWIYSGLLPATKRGGKRLIRETVLIAYLEGEDVRNAAVRAR